MIVARVVGSVVSTKKHAKYDGSKLLLVQPLARGGDDSGPEFMAVDSVGAGADETVLVVVEGRSASQAMGIDLAPANAAIIGIIDQIDWGL